MKSNETIVKWLQCWINACIISNSIRNILGHSLAHRLAGSRKCNFSNVRIADAQRKNHIAISRPCECFSPWLQLEFDHTIVGFHFSTKRQTFLMCQKEILAVAHIHYACSIYIDTCKSFSSEVGIASIYLFQHSNIFFLLISITNFTSLDENWFKFKTLRWLRRRRKTNIKTIKSKTRNAKRSFGNRIYTQVIPEASETWSTKSFTEKHVISWRFRFFFLCDFLLYGFKCEIF